MGEWFVQITGTPEGARLATMLALMSAIAHAAFGALQKGCHDPWLSRGANYGWLFFISALVTLFLVCLLTLQVAWLLAGALVIHFGYKVTMALSYERAAYTVVYPIVRGTGPLVTVLAASVMFHEQFTLVQWLGVLCFSGGILMLAFVNLREKQAGPAEDADWPAVGVGCGYFWSRFIRPTMPKVSGRQLIRSHF
jgi:multidrug transporter EmrE-like cation transporter